MRTPVQFGKGYVHQEGDGALIYAIGDIHGQYTLLQTLLAQLPYTDDDWLVFLSDYVDGGDGCYGHPDDDSPAVIELLIKLRQERHHPSLP